MAKTNSSRGKATTTRTWPRRALGVFVLLFVAIYALVFLTGDKSATPKLGIDLQGGTRVTLVPQGQEPTADQLAQARVILENRVNGMGVSGASVVTDGNTLVITVPGEDTSRARSVGQTSQLLFRPVMTPAMPDTTELPKVLGDMANRWVEYSVITKEQAESSIDTLIQGLSSALPDGTEPPKAPAITAEPKPEPANSIEATDRRQETTAMLREDRQSTDTTTQAAASTLLQCAADTPDPLSGTDDPALPLVTCDRSSGAVYLLAPAPVLVGQENETDPDRLTGAAIDTNRPINGGLNTQTGQMEISFAFDNGAGGETWAKLTRDYLQQQVAITLDSEVISAPVIQSPTPVGSATSITGQFTQQEAQDLANNLRYGALPLSFAGENGESGGTTQTIPASLGEASLKAGIIAGAVGLIAVAIFVFIYYRLYGIISIVTLILANTALYGALVLLGRWIGYSLDLAGIAGLVIGLGAMADSFVVIYERIKDEVREGHTFRSATHRGWSRARRTIVTGNMVTLIGSVVIYFLAVGEVKGFAFTLGLSTVFDLLVTFLVTAPLMLMAANKPFWAKPSVNGMGKVFKLARVNNNHAAEVAEKKNAVAVAGGVKKEI